MKDEAVGESVSQAVAVANANARVIAQHEIALHEAEKLKQDQLAEQKALIEAQALHKKHLQDTLDRLSPDERDSFLAQIKAMGHMLPEGVKLQAIEGGASASDSTESGSTASPTDAETEECDDLESMRGDFGFDDVTLNQFNQECKNTGIQHSSELNEVISIWLKHIDKHQLIVRDREKGDWYYCQKNQQGQMLKQGYLRDLNQDALPAYIRHFTQVAIKPPQQAVPPPASNLNLYELQLRKVERALLESQKNKGPVAEQKIWVSKIKALKTAMDREARRCATPSLH